MENAKRCAAAGAMLAVACSPGSRPAPVTAAWPMYRSDLARDGRASGAATLTVQEAARLRPAWRVRLGGAVDGTPAVWHGMVIAASAGGTVAALDAASGSAVWERHATGPVSASPSIAGDGVVIGTLSGAVMMLALADGKVRWRWHAPPDAAVWASPAVYRNVVVVGVASPYGDTPLVPGRLVGLDLATGRELWNTCVRRDCSPGDGVWSSPAFDPEGLAFVGVGNPDDAVLAFDPLTGRRIWLSSLYPDARRDVDVGASPIVFTLRGREVVAQATVAGLFAVLEVRTGALAWSTQVVEGSAVHGLLASPAYDGSDFYLASAGAPAGIFALDAEGGAIRWKLGTDLPLYSAPALGDGVVVFGSGDVFGDLAAGHLIALATDDGREVWTYDVHSAVRSGPALAGDLVVVGDYAGDVLGFRVGPS